MVLKLKSYLPYEDLLANISLPFTVISGASCIINALFPNSLDTFTTLANSRMTIFAGFALGTSFGLGTFLIVTMPILEKVY